MTFLRKFWDAAIATDPHGADVDEAKTMRYCNPDELRELFESVGLRNVQTGDATPSGKYESFEDLWTPLLGGIGPSGAYVRCSMTPSARYSRGSFRASWEAVIRRSS